MRYGILLLALLAAPALAGQVSFSLTNSPAEGELVVYVFNDANRFGEFRDAYRRYRFPVTAPDERYPIEALPPGDYALLIYHDENRNGVLDRNFIGIPREPIALSNDYRPKGPPSFSRARITLSEGESVHQTLTLVRPLGDRGQVSAGLGAIVRSSPYVGSNRTRVQPIPTLVYFGERLQVTGPVVNYNLAGSSRVRLTLRGELRLGAYDEDDSPMLAGLGDRQTTLFGGLALNSQIPGGLNLSLRYTHDLLGRVDAGTASASLSKGFQLGTWRVAPSVAVNWLDGPLANYEFGVPEAAARDDRPAYRVSDAITWETGITLLYEITPTWLGTLNLSYETLDRKIADSPIVADRHLTKGFFALTYTF